MTEPTDTSTRGPHHPDLEAVPADRAGLVARRSTETSLAPLDLTGPLGELLQLTAADREMQPILQDVVEFAKHTVPGVGEAGITLIRRREAGTVASTGGIADVLDELQYEAGYGPCLDAGRSNETLQIPDATTESRWPRYLVPAREAGLGSSLSLPIPVENYLVGALNLYSTVPDAFSPQAVQAADQLAVHICAALSRAEALSSYRMQVEHLHRAMDSRAVIEQAKGILMAQRRCTAVEAFTMLRTVSMNQNMKLADLAASIVSGASGHPVGVGDGSGGVQGS